MIARSPNLSSSRSWARGRGQAFIAERVLGVPAWVLLIQIFIGLGWIRAAAEKLIDPAWWNGFDLTIFLASQSPRTLGWYAPLADHVIAPNVVWFAAIVVVLQLAVGVSLLSGRAIGYALVIGMFMNLNFLAAGSVNPSVFYLVSQGAVALWLVEKAAPNKRLPIALSAIAIMGYVLAAMSLPLIRTLHPARVIEDPAIMTVLMGILTVIGCEMAHRSIKDGEGLPILNWFFRKKKPALDQKLDPYSI
jgi:hypothetical protein